MVDSATMVRYAGEAAADNRAVPGQPLHHVLLWMHPFPAPAVYAVLTRSRPLPRYLPGLGDGTSTRELAIGAPEPASGMLFGNATVQGFDREPAGQRVLGGGERTAQDPVALGKLNGNLYAMAASKAQARALRHAKPQRKQIASKHGADAGSDLSDSAVNHGVAMLAMGAVSEHEYADTFMCPAGALCSAARCPHVS
jgi:hypothetical protein